MTWTRAPAHLLAASLCLGLVLANAGRLHGVALAGSVAAAVAVVAVDSPPARLALTAVLLCSVGWWWASARLDALDRSPLLAEAGRSGRAVVVVTAPPVQGRYKLRAQGRARSFDGREVDEPVQVELPLGRSPPQGAVLDALVVVRLPPAPEHGFDERTWLRRHGVHVVLRVDEWSQIGSRGGIGGFADRLRQRLSTSIAPRLSGERRAVLEGIVLGDTAALSPGLRKDFQASGLYHLLAVSGQNVVLVAAGALILAWLAGVSRWIGELGALAGIACYVLAVGPQPSVIRAGIAGSLASLAWLSGRLRDAWYALLLAAIALLAWNPYLVYDPGFQLSFAAVGAIFTVVPRITRRLEVVPLPRGVRIGVAVSAGCGAVTAPILWAQFGYLPLLSVPANALAEPAMPVLLGLAFITAGLDTFSPSAAAVVASLDGWVAAYIALCAHTIGSLPFAEVESLRGLAGLLGVLLLAAYAWRRGRPAGLPGGSRSG
jgi:competence protein ComEC